jgi:hypothetical protein
MPLVDLDSLGNESYLKDYVTIAFTCEDANFNGMELYISEELAEKWDVGGTLEYIWDTNQIGDGECTLRAVVYDEAGNTVEKTVRVNIDNTPPNVSITSSPYKSNVIGTFTMQFSATDLNLAEVFLYIDGEMLNVTGTSSYSWYTLSVNDGEHTVTLRAVDKAGNVGETQIKVATINQRLILFVLTLSMFFSTPCCGL